MRRVLFWLCALVFWVLVLVVILALPYLVTVWGTYELRPWAWSAKVRVIWLLIQITWTVCILHEAFSDD